VWQELITNKYLHSKSCNGEEAHFWEDTWLGSSPLAQQYPSLYNIVQRKQVSITTILSQTPINIGFRQALLGMRANRWIHLCTLLMDVQLTTQPDVFKWGLKNLVCSRSSPCI
jgi:hypothetical protein